MTMRRQRLGLSLALLAACGGDDPAAIDAARIDGTPIDAFSPDGDISGLPEELPSPLPNGDVDARIMTFNIGHFATVRGGRERLPHQITAIEESGADIVCFQEVYTLPDPDVRYVSPHSLAAELADVYPYAAWSWETTNMLGSGNLIVSKVPLYRQRFLRYTMNDANTIVDRAVLAATAVSDDWHLDVLCTHLQAGLDPENAPIRLDQIRELGLFVTEHDYADGPSVLLGDFNAGPDPDPLDEECPGQEPSCPATCTPVDTATLATLTGGGASGGWTDRAGDLGFTECTYCKPEADALAAVALFPCEGSQRIDHCLSRGTGNAQISALERVMDQAVSIQLSGNNTAMTLSDHYAVKCTISAP